MLIFGCGCDGGLFSHACACMQLKLCSRVHRSKVTDRVCVCVRACVCMHACVRSRASRFKTCIISVRTTTPLVASYFDRTAHCRRRHRLSHLHMRAGGRASFRNLCMSSTKPLATRTRTHTRTTPIRMCALARARAHVQTVLRRTARRTYAKTTHAHTHTHIFAHTPGDERHKVLGCLCVCACVCGGGGAGGKFALCQLAVRARTFRGP